MSTSDVREAMHVLPHVHEDAVKPRAVDFVRGRLNRDTPGRPHINVALDPATRDLLNRLGEQQGWTQADTIDTALRALDRLIREAGE